MSCNLWDEAQGVELTEDHHRQLDLRFYRRTDGLFEVRGRMTDQKAQPFRRQLADQDTPAGALLHDISVRLVFDRSMRVLAAAASMHATPFVTCTGAEETVAPLVGLTIGAGWNRKVAEVLGGPASCTHIRELLGPMATTALQGLAPDRMARFDGDSAAAHCSRQQKVDSCFAYSSHGEVVAKLWPYLHKTADGK
jgi:hypothetical protein